MFGTIILDWKNWKTLTIAIFCYCSCCSLFAQNDTIFSRKKAVTTAVIETAGINIFVGTFNRYVTREDFAYIDYNTMRHNLRHNFVWDNDMFITNLFGHPYHGGLYFNAARSNGVNFYKSIPYAVAGSLMWEYLMENEPPSINDFISTPIGGIILGEITFRISDLLIDNSVSGLRRINREILAGIISPMRGLNRIISGEAWRVRSVKNEFSENIPVNFYAVMGHRTLSGNQEIRRMFDNGMYVDFRLLYSCLFDEDNEKPYDTFESQITFNLFSCQPIIGNVSVIGQLWGENISSKNEKLNAHWGIFQHFDYYDSNISPKENTVKSYRISEAAAFGIGGQLKTSLKKNTISIFSAYLNTILLGGCITDYFQVNNRDYNIGSGFSIKINSQLSFGTKAVLTAGLKNYRIFTWKGYNPELNLSQLTHEEQLHLNVQGDKGNVRFTICNLNFNYCVRKHYTFSVEAAYYLRNSSYKHFSGVKNSIVETKLGLGYMF
jgi:hypothetical protein